MAELLRKSMYNCKACGCFFSRSAKLQQHMSTHTPEENMLYGDIFTYHLTSIKNEVCVQRPKPKITCPLCPMMYVYKRRHKKHLLSVHGIVEKLSPTPSDILLKVSNGERNKDADGGEIVKASESSINHMTKNEIKVHFEPFNLEKAKRGTKRGRPPKERFLKQLSVSDVDEQTKRRTKRGRPPKERCHIAQLPVRDVDERGRGKVPDCELLNPKQTKIGTKRGRPLKESGHITHLPVRGVDESGRVKAPDTGPQNPEQTKRGTKRGRSPKESCYITQLSVRDVDEKERVKEPDIGPQNPEQAKKGTKRGRPPKQRCLKQLSVNDVDEQAKRRTKRGRPPKESCHITQLPVRDVDERERVKEPDIGPQNPKQAKKGTKRGRPPKERCHTTQLPVRDDENGRVKVPDFGLLNPELTKRGTKRGGPPKERCLKQLPAGDVDEQAKKGTKSGRSPKGRCLKQAKRGTKRGRPPKESCHITHLPVRDVDERGRVKDPDFEPLNSGQAKRGTKRKRPPKERCLEQLSVSDVDEPAKRGTKRGTPPKGKCLKQLSVSDADEQAKRGTKGGTPPKGRCHIKQLPVKDDERGRVKATECPRNRVVKNEKKVHCGPQSSKQPAKRRKKHKRPFKKYYECRECKKRMTQTSSLRAHMRIHTGERPYQCLVCSKTFTFYQCLWNHSWLHKRTNSFPCDKCPKKFRYYQSLWTHYKTHAGEKLFKCTTCKLGFATSVQLNHHEKKQHEKKGGDLKKNRRRYLRTKVKEMQFMCDVCFKKFRLRISLVSHKEKCDLKRQLSLKMSRKNKEASKTLLITGAGLDQNQKGRGKSRKFVKPKVERRVFVNSQTLKGDIRKRHDTCFTCKKVYKNCVCRVKSKGKNKNKRYLPRVLPLSPETDGRNVNVPNQLCHFGHRNKMANRLHTQRKPKCYGSKKTAEALLRRSKRLKGEEPVVSQCETYDQSYRCLHCSKSFKYLSWLLRHQNSGHIDAQKEIYHVKNLMTPQNGKKHRKRSLESKCSCCGTVFISSDDYKKHIACVSCVCGQHFQCAYIFCFHTSTCGKRSVSVEEETVDQKSKEASVSHSSEETFPCEQHVGQPHFNTLLCGNSESNQMSADSVSPVLNTSDSAFPPSSDHNQAEAWFWQLINEEYTSEIGINEIIHPAMPDDSVEIGEDPWHAQEIPWGSEAEHELHSDQEADKRIEISSKLPGNRQRFQCIICSEEFLSESDLASHSLSHLTVDF